MAAGLFLSSWEVIARRSWLMASGTCSRSEYQRMVSEKVSAAQQSLRAIWRSKSAGAILAPGTGALPAMLSDCDVAEDLAATKIG
jgi:hypothetical protein